MNEPNVEVQMLIRKPVAEVFNAFIDPAITKNFWFTKASGKLEPGKTITWEWEMYNLSTEVRVLEITENQRIRIEWDEPPTQVEFEFTAPDNNSTYIIIRNSGFWQQGLELVNVIKDSTGGFTTVLDGLKAYLEHNINLNLIDDKFPKGLADHGTWHPQESE